MDTAPQPDATTSSTSAAQMETDLTATLASADTTTASRIQNLVLVHQARLTQLTRTAANATAQYGAGSAQAAAAQADVTSTASTIGRVTLVNQQVTTPAPQVSTSGWALYGYLTTPPAQPVPGFAVFLVDAQNAYQSAYGFTYTDSNGFFQLVYNGSATGVTGTTTGTSTGTPPVLQLLDQKQEQPATEQTQQQAQSLPVNLPTPTLYLEIANAKGQVVYLSKTAFQPTLGQATYQNIQLAAGAPVIGNPPAALRGVALPKVGKKT